MILAWGKANWNARSSAFWIPRTSRVQNREVGLLKKGLLGNPIDYCDGVYIYIHLYQLWQLNLSSLTATQQKGWV